MTMVSKLNFLIGLYLQGKSFMKAVPMKKISLPSMKKTHPLPSP
jgi:hypothetical protein